MSVTPGCKPGEGRHVKLPDFKPPEERGKKSHSRRLRAADGPNWTPSEKLLRNRLLKKNLGMEGTRGNTDQYRDAWDLMFNASISEGERAEIEARWRNRLEAQP